MNFRKKKILVTGASGFVARNIAASMNTEEFRLYGLSRHPRKDEIWEHSYPIDITKPFSLREHFDAVSYTHLDVYKRQTFLRLQEIDRVIKNSVMMFGAFEIMDRTGFLIISQCLRYLTAVSYTHLDLQSQRTYEKENFRNLRGGMYRKCDCMLFVMKTIWRFMRGKTRF